MRDYAKVSPQFWIGATGKKLRTSGMEAQIVAMYLVTSPHANMLGLYYLPKMYLAHETGLPIKGASKGLRRSIEAGFCHYDEASEMVWVPEMASYQIGDALDARDKRCIGIQREYDALPNNPYLEGFFTRYGSAFHMTRARSMGGETPSPIGGASEAHRSQEHEQEHEQEQYAREACAAPTAKPNGKHRKPAKTPLPDDFALDADLERYAQAHLPAVDPPELLESFRGKATAKGWTYANWRAAFQEFVRNCAPESGHWAAGQYPKTGSSNPRKWL